MSSFALPGNVAFFHDSLREQLSQGDIFVAPSVVLCDLNDLEVSDNASLPPVVGERRPIRIWGRPEPQTEGAAPAVGAIVSWTPVIVLSHDCEIDKQFNEEIDRYLTDNPGSDEKEVIAYMSARGDLDRHILVSPLLPYVEEFAPEWKHDSIERGVRIGYFPVPAVPQYNEDGFFIHLAQVSTVERGLLAPGYKVASLSEPARALVRFKIAEALASRNLSLFSKLESAVGRTIADVKHLKSRNSKVTVGLLLDDGTELQVDAKADPKGEVPPERLRTS